MPPVVAAVGAIAIGVSGVAATVLTAVGVSAAVAGAISGAILMAGISGLASAALKVVGLGPRPPKASPASTERLKAGLDPRSFRKIVFGQTAANLDMHYQEFTGTSQEYLNSIITLASHELHSIDEIWFDEKKAWDSSGVIHPDFTGYLAVQKREVGTTANALTITGSSSWVSSASRLVGCSYIWLRYKLTGNDKKAESPFAQNVTSRITVRVRGAKLYDPRRDSTMGGSGSQRVNDQTTWAWVNDDTGRNPALQLLWYLLGWRIQNPSTGAWKLAVGLGLPVERLDIPSFIAAANLCDEAVTKASGGTEPRYRSDGVFSEGDDPLEVIDNLRATMNGVLRDAGGKLKLDILHNDLGSPVCDLSAGDVIGEFTWTQTPPIDETFNVVRGRYVDPTDAGLYQLVDYPDVSIPSPDGIERASSFDMPMVQSPSQAQRLAKTYLQRAQYPGTFMAEFLASAWRCEVGSVVRLTFPALGFVDKLFRVVEHSINVDGRCPMVLREENASIYAWDADESPAVSAATPISYNPLNDPILQGISDIAAGPTAIVYIYQRASSAPSLPTADVTYTFADHTISGLTGGWSATIPAGANPLYVAAATASYNGGTDIITPAEWSSPVVLAQDGAPGAAGVAATSAYLTNEVAQVFAYANGNVVSYAPATGEFKVFAGSADISSNFTLSVVSNPQTLTVSFTGRVYTVTGGFDAGEDTATVTIRATGSGSYAGVTFDKVFALAKAKGGYEIVSTLPITNLFEGRIVFLTTDDKLYRYTGSAWSKAVDGADIQANSILTNSIGAGQITAAKLASTELITLSAQIGTAVITGAKIGNLEVNTLKIANNAVNAVVTSYGGAGTVSDTLDVDFGSVSLSTIGGIVRIDISFDSRRSSGSTSVNLTAQIVRVVGTTETVIEQRRGASSASFPPTSFFITDSPGAGSVSYKARFSVDGGSGSFAVSSVAFAATEIKR